MKLSNSKLKKKYKAIICDIDGTLIISKKDGIPSQKVTAAISKANKILHVGVATSRCYYFAKHIIDHLNLSGPSIFNGGGQIMNFPQKKYVLQQTMSKKDIPYLISVFEKYKRSVTLCDGKSEDTPYVRGNPINKIFMIYSQGVEEKIANKIIKEISHIPTISIFTTHSWTKGKIDVLVQHAKSTKQHAVFEVAKLLNINTHEIIGVGDGYNDFPLLMACGLKVAMGNAVDELKEIADYIAPSVEENGVADIIEKFVLKNDKK